jgi:hypothetical protein
MGIMERYCYLKRIMKKSSQLSEYVFDNALFSNDAKFGTVTEFVPVTSSYICRMKIIANKNLKIIKPMNVIVGFLQLAFVSSLSKTPFKLEFPSNIHKKISAIAISSAIAFFPFEIKTFNQKIISGYNFIIVLLYLLSQ